MQREVFIKYTHKHFPDKECISLEVQGIDVLGI